MTEHNAQAVQAAVEAVLPQIRQRISLPDGEEWARAMVFDVACAAVDAATPHILAAAGKVITEDQAREIMQQQVKAQKQRLLAEVAAAADEALEHGLRQVQVAERESIALLAGDVGAVYQDHNGDTAQFADLIRAQR